MTTEPEPAAADRVAELRENLAAVRARIAAACDRAGRDPAEITLIAVTKTFPASDVRLLAGLGITDVGENRDQEAAPKAAACEGLALRWHFIGQLQVNKCASVVRYCAVVHSVDRSKLVRALASRAEAAGRVVTCLIQVSLDDAVGRGGAVSAQVPDLASEIAAEPSLRLGGVMAVAPLGQPARPAFARLRTVANDLLSAHPGASVISAGMSGDLDDAIAEGATHVRVGTALLGGRPGFVR